MSPELNSDVLRVVSSIEKQLKRIADALESHAKPEISGNVDDAGPVKAKEDIFKFLADRYRERDERGG